MKGHIDSAFGEKGTNVRGNLGKIGELYREGSEDLGHILVF